MIKALLGGVLAGIVFVGGAAHAQSADYRLAATVPLGAPDRWDYVVFEPQMDRIYVAHGDRLAVVDALRAAVIGEVTGIAGGTHGAAVSIADGRGYTDDGEAGKAVVFDLKSLKVLRTVPAAPDADAIARDAKSGHIFIVDGDTGAITVIDPVADKVVATIKPGGKLESGVADDAGKLYVNGAADKTILRIDTATNAVDARWPVPDCTSPHGLALDVANHRLFSSCVNNRLVVVDTGSGREVASLPIGAGTDSAAFDPVRKRVFSSNGRDGTISVIQEVDPNTYRALEPVKTAVSGRTMAVDTKTGRLFVAAADIDPAGPKVGRPKFLPGSLKLLVFDPVR